MQNNGQPTRHWMPWLCLVIAGQVLLGALAAEAQDGPSGLLCSGDALALQQVQRDLAAQGLGLKVWDAYRPMAVQQQMWEAIRDERYVSNPAVNAGRHTRGTAVDLTLVDRSGQELAMPTGFDDFSQAAHRQARGIAPERTRHAQQLQTAMERRGFVGLASEWWHFDWHDWQRYPVVTP